MYKNEFSLTVLQSVVYFYNSASGFHVFTNMSIVIKRILTWFNPPPCICSLAHFLVTFFNFQVPCPSMNTLGKLLPHNYGPDCKKYKIIYTLLLILTSSFSKKYSDWLFDQIWVSDLSQEARLEYKCKVRACVHYV